MNVKELIHAWYLWDFCVLCISYNFLSLLTYSYSFFLFYSSHCSLSLLLFSLKTSRLNCRQHPCFMDDFYCFKFLFIEEANTTCLLAYSTHYFFCYLSFIEFCIKSIENDWESINGKSNFQIQNVMWLKRSGKGSVFVGASFSIYLNSFFFPSNEGSYIISVNDFNGVSIVCLLFHSLLFLSYHSNDDEGWM